MKRGKLVPAIGGFLVVCISIPAYADVSISLKKEFIKTYKNRATIRAEFTVDRAHKLPNPPAKDGDMHVAGRSDDIGLPVVAELMNARNQPAAIDVIKNAEATAAPISIAGAWRLWCEHGGSKDQVQGQQLEPFTTTNPDHVFEVHPLTQVGVFLWRRIRWSRFSGIGLRMLNRPSRYMKISEVRSVRRGML